MNKYSDISPEDRAIIVISINFQLGREDAAHETALYSVLTEMFRRHPAISFFDFPLVFSVVRDFYLNLRNEDKNGHTELVDVGVLAELKDHCEHLLDKMKDVCIKNNLELNQPS